MNYYLLLNTGYCRPGPSQSQNLSLYPLYPPPLAPSCLHTNPGSKFLIFHSKISLFHIKSFFLKISDDVIFNVICGLRFPNQKSWIRLCQNSINFYVRLFSFERIKKQSCPLAEYSTFLRTGRTRGQGQGLELRDQGQELQNKSLRTSLRPRTSSRTPLLIM